MAYYQGQPTQPQYPTQQTSAINVPQQQRQSRGRASTTVPYDYQEQTNPQYVSHQSSALAVPPQPRQSTRPHSISPHTSTRGDYTGQQSGYPSSYTGPSHTQMAYSDPPYDSGFLTAGPVDPAFPEPHPSAGGAMQRSHSGQYTSSTGTVRRSPSAHTANLYSTTNSSVRRSPSQQPSALRAHAGSSVRRSPSTHSTPLYPQGTANTSVHRRAAEQPAAHYVPAGYSVHSRQEPQPPLATHYPSGTQAYDSTNTSYSGPQPTSHYAVPHGQGANTSDGRYQTAAPVTRVTPEPPYRVAHSQERGATTSQAQYDAYEYDDLNENERVSKGPPLRPAHGNLAHACRMLGCNRPMFFDRRFNEFWEWCSTQHIHEALARGMERPCKRCAVWPRRNGFRYCGGDACNKRGVPLG